MTEEIRDLQARDPEAAARLIALKMEGNLTGAWRWYCSTLFDREDPLDLHARVYRWVYDLSDGEGYPAPAWVPDEATIEAANITALCRELRLNDADELYRWSVANRSRFWELMIQKLGIRFDVPPGAVLGESSTAEQPEWLPGARFNCAENCFHAPSDQTAVIVGKEDGTRSACSYGELRVLANRVANGLRQAGIREGDAVAVVMPMTLEAVGIYLGTILAGAAVVSIADSFAAPEIALRLAISNTKLVLTQNVILRGGKEIPLYERVRAAGEVPAVIFQVPETTTVALRQADRLWEDFLSEDGQFTPVSRGPDDAINILFSSGTTGSPKAIPWVQTTPLKCAADGYIHHDLRPGDVLCWPTNLGWMMGPWLIFASLINRGAMAIYEGAPHGEGFCRFVEEARVTVLGVIPSLVRAWRERGVLEKAEWPSLRAFSSTGECSNPADMFHLMSRAGFRPVIEYCGGTELAGGYISAVVTKSLAPGTFNLPACGVELLILDEEDQPSPKGEAFLAGPSIGFSTRLMNKDHHAVYFAETPVDSEGRLLRRHGDHLERLDDGAFRALGRQDDTMNLGGIKVGSAEIERALATDPGVHEVAAIASDGSGPSRLIVFVVPNNESEVAVDELEERLQRALREHLNPLFKISEVHLIDTLPRTASNKVMRRLLRSRLTL